MIRFLLLFSFFLASSLSLLAQKSGLKGSVKDQQGKAVSFASIGIEKQALGTMANEEGIYQLDLKPGNYVVYFHCLGFQSIKQEVEISGTGFVEMNVEMTEQVIQTREVQVGAGSEDPAYSIMRKAIARAKINKLLLDAYTAQVYIKGSARILKMPFLVRKLAEEEGINDKTVFFTETLENLDFKQPNIYKERVIAARSTFGKVKVGQQYIKEDLYNPNFGQCVSPLSPAAFRTYKFQYLGFFTDQGHDVFKIKVIPRGSGQNVWSGEIFMIDKIWQIHSAHLEGVVEGFNVNLVNVYSPLEGIWLPVQIKQEFRGTILQADFEVKYNASISKYKITKNERLYADFQKLEQEIDQKTDQEINKNPTRPDLKAREKEDKKMLKKLARAYVKEKFKLRRKSKTEKPISKTVQSEYQFGYDSTAFDKDLTFWEENRAVPLSEMEVKSFIKLDSIRKVDERKDSLKAKKKKKEGFSVSDLISGGTYFLGKKDSLKRHQTVLKYFSPLTEAEFNAVEGYALQGGIWLKRYLRQSYNRMRDDRPFIQFGPTVRYSFARQKVMGKGVFQIGNPKWVLQFSGGTEVRQINPGNPISTFVNSSYALFDTRNFMKLYEADFGKIQFLKRLSGEVETEVAFEVANRIPLSNSISKGQWGKNKSFAPNEVDMNWAEKAETERSVAAIFSTQIDWYPGLVSYLYNGYQNYNSQSAPRFRISYRQGISGLGNAKAEFSQLALSYRHSLALSSAAQLEVFGQAQVMPFANRFGQMDVNQLMGNQTFLLGSLQVEQFRNLNYYAFSSSKNTYQLHLHLFRNELLFGWLVSKKKNWREKIFANGMANTDQSIFWEAGYGLDKLFRFVTVEAVYSQWEKDKGEWRFMLGTSFNFGISPRTYEKSTEQAVSF
jgi:hypothetical protein